MSKFSSKTDWFLFTIEVDLFNETLSVETLVSISFNWRLDELNDDIIDVVVQVLCVFVIWVVEMCFLGKRRLRRRRFLGRFLSPLALSTIIVEWEENVKCQ